MRQSKPTLKSIARELNLAWKLMHQLAETLTRIASDTAALSEDKTAKEEAKVGRARKTAGKKPAKQGRKATGLPDTTGDFFAKHIKKRRQTATQIFQSVLESLDFEPTREQAAVLRNRLNVWLANAVKSQSNPVSSVGAGKDRQYYRA